MISLDMRFPDNVNDARKIQFQLKQRVKITSLKNKPQLVAGVDAAYTRTHVISVACLYNFPDLHLIEETHFRTKISFPYIPGFLSFREGPAIIGAIKRLTPLPDVILFDGQGVAHPSHIGIASHMGVLLNIPSIGCAKSRLVGDYSEPGPMKGQYSNLTYQHQIVGAVLRTRKGVKPIFISPGHLVNQKGSINIVLQCTGKYRIPEPLRRADLLSKELKRKLMLKTV